MIDIKGGLKFITYLDYSGYSMTSQAYLSGLISAGIPVSWHPLVSNNTGFVDWQLDRSDPLVAHLPSSLLDTVHRPVSYDKVILNTIPDYWGFLLEPEKINIGMTVWETDKVPARWVHLLNQMHRVLVPCGFNQSVFQNCGVTTPVGVVPYIKRSVRANMPDEQIKAFRIRHEIPEQDVLFYTINTWTERKAMRQLVQAFLEAFEAGDSATLLIKTSDLGQRDGNNRQDEPTQNLLAELLKEHGRDAKVRLINQAIPNEEIDLLHLAADCYVSLTRAEGWGMGAFDAGAFGNPVIITDWGGHKDYLSHESALLVDCQLTPVVETIGSPYRKDQNWAEPNLADAIEKMRWVVANRGAAEEMGSTLRADLEKRFSEEQITALLIKEAGL